MSKWQKIKKQEKVPADAVAPAVQMPERVTRKNRNHDKNVNNKFYVIPYRELLHLMVKSSVAQNKTNRDMIPLMAKANGITNARGIFRKKIPK